MPAVRREEGAVLVEFALVAPVFLLLLVGMLQFGIILNAKINQTHLASSGARYAAVDQNPNPDGTLQDYIKSRAGTQGLRTGSTVCLEFLEGETSTFGQPGDPVKVTMSYGYDLLPFLDNRLSVGSVSVVGDATMRLETVPDEIDEGCTT